MLYTLGEQYIVLTDLLPVERKQQGFLVSLQAQKGRV